MINRTIHSAIIAALDIFPVIVVTGPRQVGKSTEVFQLTLTHDFKYVSLDNIENRRLALSDPRYFIEINGFPLVIDEVQYAPVLMEVIQEIVNNRRLNGEHALGLFVLTGSQTFQLMRHVTQSMAGRAAIFKMEPLSYHEIQSTPELPFIPTADAIDKSRNSSITELYQQIIKGCYPELFSNQKITYELFYENYIATYIDRDITELINIKNKLKFHGFMQVLASLTGQQLNVNNLSKVIGISNHTIGEWLSVLETSGIIYLLYPYNELSMVKRVVKTPKIYFADTGMAAYLMKIHDAQSLEVSIFAGQFMETFVINEIRKSYINNGKSFNGFYYRDSNQNEIDLILVENSIIHMIEIKKGISFTVKDVKAFSHLKLSKFKIGHSCIICNTPQGYALHRELSVLSVNAI